MELSAVLAQIHQGQQKLVGEIELGRSSHPGFGLLEGEEHLGKESFADPGGALEILSAIPTQVFVKHAPLYRPTYERGLVYRRTFLIPNWG